MKNTTAKKFKYGSLSVVFTVVFIALVIGVNLIVSALDTSFNLRVDLTETEYKILRMLMQNPERIFSVEMIYETVWGEPYYYTSNGTVMVHIRNLRTKIEADPQNPKRVCTVWGKGYRFVNEEQV